MADTIALSLLGNKYMIGFTSIFINIGTSFLLRDLVPIVEKLFESRISKFVVLFMICLTSSRDIVISLSITVLIYIFIVYLMDPSSPYCLYKDEQTTKKSSTIESVQLKNSYTPW